MRRVLPAFLHGLASWADLTVQALVAAGQGAAVLSRLAADEHRGTSLRAAGRMTSTALAQRRFTRA